MKYDVIAVAGHDTQSAMVAVPTQEDDFIFLSCGTWSLLGTELKTPIINETSASLNITNEGGADNKTSFLKNIIGLCSFKKVAVNGLEKVKNMASVNSNRWLVKWV